MLAPAADIMYSVDEDAGEVTFSANTAKGEQWMGGYKKLCHSRSPKITAMPPSQQT
jgi:hypothetical protein